MSKRILDDMSEIRKIDRNNMLSFCVDAPKHYSAAVKIAKKMSVNYPKPKTILVAGMGGSGIGGELLKDWARDRVTVPIEICKEYSLPKYVDEDTLVIVVSYSGETEESLSSFLQAVKRKCMCFCITSGGTLSQIAKKFCAPHVLVPSGMAPRATMPYLFTPLPILLEKIGLVSGVDKEISETARILRQVSDANSPEKPLKSNFSKKLAYSICGTVPIVYGFGSYRAVAQRIKCQFNENSKILAKWETFPELNHNEIVGWEAIENLAKCFSTVFIRGDDEPEPIRRRIEATKQLISNKTAKIFEIHSTGESIMAKMFSVICAGDFTSVYLAVLRGIDPTPVRTIDLLKKKIKQSGFKEKVLRELQKLAK